MADIEAEGKAGGNGVSSFVSPLANAMNKETQHKVETLMKRMAEGSETYTLYVKIFKMEMFDGIKPAEIARRLHVARNYVDVAVRRVRDRLRTLARI
jgi:DNA-directed RNA polymerase specialized sigma24 family protein